MSSFTSIITSVVLSSINTFWSNGCCHHTNLDLLVNGQDNPVGIVDLDDMKPGDDRYVDKDLYVKGKDAKIFMHLKDLASFQGTQTEPEEEEEAE